MTAACHIFLRHRLTPCVRSAQYILLSLGSSNCLRVLQFAC
jgi:hypothetical protein